MRKAEIDRKFDEIVDFAEMAEFIDTPVKRYSSGMQVKLAFAVATSIEAEILIVDEVLAVGDLAFQRKCFDRMEDLIKRRGRTVLLVSHNIRQVDRLCSRAIMLDHGKIVADGPQAQVCEQFYSYNNDRIARQKSTSGSGVTISRSTEEIQLLDIALLDKEGIQTDRVAMNEPLTVRCRFSVTRKLLQPETIVGFHTTDFFYIASLGNGHIEARADFEAGVSVVDCHIGNFPLMPGLYAIRVGVLDRSAREVFYGESLKTFAVHSNSIPTSRLPQVGIISIPAQWDVTSCYDNRRERCVEHT
jgi:hypothetical protein